MSSYSSLNPHTQLEQAITYDLQSTLEKRGFSVTHNGTNNTHAPGGKPDIVIFDENYVLIFEVTKSKSSNQDREFQSIRDHLKEIKAKNPEKYCFCVFVSPKTSDRTLDSIHDHNHQRASEGKADMKILPFAFSALELWVTRLKENPEYQYPVTDFIVMFEQYSRFINDFQVLRLLAENVFPNDREIAEIIAQIDFVQDKQETVLGDLVMFANHIRLNHPNLSQFDVNLQALFELLINRSTRSWKFFVKATGLSTAQAELSKELYHHGSFSISEISELFKISVPAASQLAEKLVRSGLAEKTEDPANRRVKQLILSPKGTALVEEEIYHQHSWVDEIEQKLSKEELEQVTEMFKILAKVSQNV